MIKKVLFSAALLGAVAACCKCYNDSLEVTHYSVFSDISHPIRLLCLSDMHGNSFGRRNSQLLEKAREICPDIIVFPGDTLSADCHGLKTTLFTLRELSLIAPCFLIAGNHEHRSGRWEQIRAQYEAAGVTVLENERWDGEINGVAVHILGLDEGLAVSQVDYIKAALKTLKYKDNREALRELCCLEGAKIVLSHFPENFARIGELSYCRFGFDLMLSGHAHGGHMRFDRKHALFAAGQGFLPPFCQGIYGSYPRLFVSRGLGNDSPVPRINNRPEMAVITLSRRR